MSNDVKIQTIDGYRFVSKDELRQIEFDYCLLEEKSISVEYFAKIKYLME